MNSTNFVEFYFLFFLPININIILKYMLTGFSLLEYTERVIDKRKERECMPPALTTENSKALSFLLRSAQDEAEFITCFWQGEDKQFFSINAYRLHKINQMNIGNVQFEQMFQQSSRDALEQLFQQPLDITVYQMIMKKVVNGLLTSKMIYDKFIEEDKRLNVARLAN